MGAYLTVDSPLIPPDVREGDAVTLDEEITKAEADIIDAYRIWDGDAYQVMLYGYDTTNDPAAVQAQFLLDMAATVAMVVTERLRSLDHQSGVKSETDGRRSRTYRDNFNRLWPSGWGARLTKHDLRARCHVV